MTSPGATPIGAQIFTVSNERLGGGPPARTTCIVVEPDPIKAREIAEQRLGPGYTIIAVSPLPQADTPLNLPQGHFGWWT
jgi:hypothetical protein